MTTGRISISSHWFNGSTTYASLVAVWTKYWAYLSINGVAPVWVGEFGTTNNNIDIQSNVAGSQGQWFQSMVTFLHNNSQIDWTYWALNSEDSYSLLGSNYASTPGERIEAAAAGDDSIRRQWRKLPGCAFRADGLDRDGRLLQPDQPELDGRHSAAKLQRHLQPVLQHQCRSSRRHRRTALPRGCLLTASPTPDLQASTTYYYIVRAS